jgi:hypothetical protein
MKWKYYFNLRPRLLFLFQKPRLSNEAQRVVGELNKAGICLTHCDKLFGPGAFDKLKDAVQKVRAQRDNDIQTARNSASKEGTLGEKNYAMFLLDKPALDPADFFVQFALQEVLLDIANSYMEMFTKLWLFNIWQTFVTQSPPKESQLWHFDADDRMDLKCFVYVSDVDEGAGPFTYAPGTHAKMPKVPTVEKIPGSGGRSNDEQMEKRVPKQAWIQAVGPAGTIVFADTSGYHKGGLCRRNERVMYECMYVSQAARRPEHFVRKQFTGSQLDRKRAFALSPSDPKFTQEFLAKSKRNEMAL